MNALQPASSQPTATSTLNAPNAAFQAPPAGFERIGSAPGLTGVPGLPGGWGAGFDRLTSVPYAPGIVDKLGGADSNNFSRLASLGTFAVPPGAASTFGRVPSSAAAAEAFNRGVTSFVPFTNTSFDRLGSLGARTASSGGGLDQNGNDAHGKSGPGSMSSTIPGAMVGYPHYQAAGFARIPSMGQGMHGMHGLPLGLPPGQHTAASMGMAAGKDAAGHMNQMGMAQTPAGRVPNMDMGWRGPGGDIFRAPSSGLPSMIGQMSAEAAAQGNFHWDPVTLGGAGNMMDMWGGMHVMPPGLHGLGFGHEHMPMMPQAMYAAHGLQMPPSLVGRPQMQDDDGGKGKKGRGKNKNKSKNSDAEAGAKKKRRAEKREGGAGSGAEDDGQGFEKHNQFLWAKRMGQQNEPRWGLFKQGGSAGPAFLKLLEELETDGIIERQFGEQVPENLNGVSGWIVKEGMMEAWQRRRQAWFMEGKEGKEFKPNSLYQIMRRLGFFPTMRSSRAGHGHDFEGSSVFRWDSDRKYSQRRHSKNAGDDDDKQQQGNGMKLVSHMPMSMNTMPLAGHPVGMMPNGMTAFAAGVGGIRKA